MTWTSSYSGTGPCGIINTGGTLTSQGAKYAAAYSYDNLDRLTSGPADGGSGYTYDDSAHLDASGNIVCRAENGSSGSCAGTNPASWTGAQLGWDSAGRLVSWQNAPTNPSSTDAYAYDGEGQRVWQQSTTSGTATPSTTVYVGANLVDYTYGSGGSSTGHTNHYELPGGIGLLGVRGGSSTHLFLRDHLGTPVVQLDGTSGAVQNELLTQPYGRFRYGATTLYSYAFTGQRRDTTPDVMYFNARYYDQQSGAFLSADTVLDAGLNRYAYVKGNPETDIDPTGHRRDCTQFNDCSSGGGGSSSPPSSGGCTSENCGDNGGCYTNCGGTPPPPPGRGCTSANCGRAGGSSPSTNVTVLGATANVERERIARMIAKLDQKTEYVSGYTNSYGTEVAPYMRRPGGTLAKLRFLQEYQGWVEAAGWFFTAVGFVLDAQATYSSYYRARPDQGQVQAVGMGVVHASYVTGGALIGGFLGTFIPIPFIGTAVGAFAGAWAGGWIGDQFVAAQATPNNSYSGPDNQDVPGPAAGL